MVGLVSHQIELSGAGRAQFNHLFVSASKEQLVSEDYIDRYTYEATNAKGQRLTIRDGTQNAGRNYSSIYTFAKDGSDYVLEDYGGGKAALSIGSYPNKGMTYDCTTDGNP